MHSYCVINCIANQKIIKKFDKIFKQFNVENSKALVYDFIKDLEFLNSTDDVIELRQNITKFYSISFANNNISNGAQQLEERMRGFRNKDKALVSFYLGILITLLFSYIIVNFLGSKINYFLYSRKQRKFDF